MYGHCYIPEQPLNSLFVSFRYLLMSMSTGSHLLFVSLHFRRGEAGHLSPCCTATFNSCVHRSLLAFSLHFSSSSAFLIFIFTQSSHLSCGRHSHTSIRQYTVLHVALSCAIDRSSIYRALAQCGSTATSIQRYLEVRSHRDV